MLADVDAILGMRRMEPENVPIDLVEVTMFDALFKPSMELQLESQDVPL